ncbi:MAG: GNAT family N-acetyltransferase [Pseudomonadota bacterium]
MLPAHAAPQLEYVREPDVSAALDGELRALISGSFTSPENAFLKHQRWVREMPLHRYLLRALDGQLVAHAAVHEKRIGIADDELMVGGVAEVCVLETHRRRGYVRRLLEAAHAGMRERSTHFALLMGNLGVYRSSGYRPVTAPVRRLDHRTQAIEFSPLDNVLYRQLTDQPWPEGPVDLRGPLF